MALPCASMPPIANRTSVPAACENLAARKAQLDTSTVTRSVRRPVRENVGSVGPGSRAGPGMAIRLAAANAAIRR